MALHTKLPIYKVAYDLLNVAVDYVQNMPRPFKTAIGGRVRDLCIDIVLLIFKANCAAQKTPYLDALLEQLEELQLLLRLCMDKRFISKAQYAHAVELTNSVGRQANGLMNKDNSGIVVVYSLHDELTREHQARRPRHADVQALEIDDAALQHQERCQLPVLRGGRHQGLRTLARFFAVSCGHGRLSRSFDDAGQDQERRGLQAGQLPLADASGSESKSPLSCRAIDAQQHYSERDAMGCRDWDHAQYSAPAHGSRVAVGPRVECGDAWRSDAEQASDSESIDAWRPDKVTLAVGDRLRHHAEYPAHAITAGLAAGSCLEAERAQPLLIPPVDRGIDFVGQVIKPWCRTIRRRTFRDALHRTAAIPRADLFETANSYFGLMRQATHSHGDRLRLAKVVHRRGRAVDLALTKTYRVSRA